jgi:hypothetical protein
MLKILSRVLGAALPLVLLQPAQARDPLRIDVEVEGNRGSRGFTSVEQLLDAPYTSSLRGIVPSYTENSPASARLDIRGAPALASFAANSPALRVQIPASNLDRTFQGATREESVRLLQRYLEGSEGEATRNAILRSAVRSSPIDPVAGGPNSALTQLGVSDFNRALQSPGGDRTGFGIGARIGSFSAAGYDSRNVTIPMDASWRVTERDTLSLEVPLAYTDSNGAASYSGNVGLLYRRQVTSNWAMQLSGRLGAAGSVDLGSGSGVYSFGAVSTLRLPIGENWRVNIINSITYVSTIPSAIGRYAVDYDVANTIFRNGVVVSRDLPFSWMGYDFAVSGFAVDTRFAGSPVFVRNFQEFGAFVSPGRDARFGLGLNVMTGDRGLFGVTLSTGVRF